MRFVTLADDLYAPGLAALLQSLVENSELDDLEVLVVVPGPLSPHIRGALDASGARVRYVDRSTLGEIDAKPGTGSFRYVTSLQKLLVFNLPPSRDHIAYIDTDIICVGSLRGLEAMAPISVVADRGFTEPLNTDGSPMFNAGFFTFHPDPALLAELLRYYQESDRHFPLGDQVLLNEFLRARHPDDVQFVDQSWNMLTLWLCLHPELAVEDSRLLHFVGHKPWINPWRPYAETTRRMADLYRLWWDYYLRSPMADALPLRPPPRGTIELSHSAAVRPLWRGARWAGTRARRVLTRPDPGT